MNWPRDWVFRVISPFLTQLKNRLANIRIDGAVFYNAENVATDISQVVHYTANIASDNYGADGRLLLNAPTATDYGIEVSDDKVSFRLTKDAIVSITVEEGLRIPFNSTGYVELVPSNGTSNSDYENVFGKSMNRPNSTGSENIFRRYVFQNSSGWTDVKLEWNNIYIKANQWVSFVTDTSIELDGKDFGRISINGVIA